MKQIGNIIFWLVTTQEGLLVLGTIGILLLAIGLHSYLKAKASLNWEKTKGIIEKSNADSATEDDLDSTLIEYIYTVDDKIYHNDRISTAVSNNSFASDLYSLHIRFPIGRDVVVHYDKKNPENSALFVGTGTNCFFPMTLGAVCMLYSIVVLVIT